jgi:hypothetical protein
MTYLIMKTMGPDITRARIVINFATFKMSLEPLPNAFAATGNI